MESSSLDSLNFSLIAGVVVKWDETKLRAHKDKFGPENLCGFACSLSLIGDDGGDLCLSFPRVIGASGKDWGMFYWC